MKYYFITYQATNMQGSISIWNQVINVSPMKFIKDVEETEHLGSRTYHDFVVINTCKISKKEFQKYDGQFLYGYRIR